MGDLIRFLPMIRFDPSGRIFYGRLTVISLEKIRYMNNKKSVDSSEKHKSKKNKSTQPKQNLVRLALSLLRHSRFPLRRMRRILNEL